MITKGDVLVKKGDFLWGLGILAFVLFIIVPTTHEIFVSATASHPYMVGFLKFFILATMGELLAVRIVKGEWEKPRGLIWRAVIWGLLGSLLVAIFGIYATGVGTLVEKGLLPGKGMPIIVAFLISSFMNITFAPTMMMAHRITDTYIDLKYAGNNKVTLKDIAEEIDWNGFISFVLFKTVPIFWIPAHTITFMLPAEYRVLAAAMLSIALGAILAFAKKKK